MKKINFIFILISIFLYSCINSHTPSKHENTVQVTFLHLNDVYEISPLSNGKVGGMARVGSVRQELLKENPNTITVLSGDFLSPSVIGTLKYEGKTIAGKQMVETMNAVGIDWVCFGNHEFDLNETDLLARINESRFNWLNTNALHIKDNQTLNFSKIQNGQREDFLKTKIFNFDGVKIGMFAVVLPANQKPFVAYEDVFEAAKKAYSELKPQCDFVVALTHLNKAEDRKLAEILPEVKLLMGGHDHDHMLEKIGNVVIAKADANAKTVYIHRISFNKKTKSIKIDSELKEINDKITENQIVAEVVKKWETFMDSSLKNSGIDKDEIVYETKVPLDGRESSVRNFPTNLTELITQSMTKASKGSDCSIFNSGSIRIDDQIEGKVSQLDIVRTLPYGGKIVEVKLKGRLLEQILITGSKNKGTGGFLQWDKISYDAAKQFFLVNGKLLDVNDSYWVVVPDFLISGNETNLSFFTRKNPDVLEVRDNFSSNDIRNDIRKVLIEYMKSL